MKKEEKAFQLSTTHIFITKLLMNHQECFSEAVFICLEFVSVEPENLHLIYCRLFEKYFTFETLNLY